MGSARVHPQPEVKQMAFEEVIRTVVQVVEAAGAGIMVLGGASAFVVAVPRALAAASRKSAYTELRRNLGRAILLGRDDSLAGGSLPEFAHEPARDRRRQDRLVAHHCPDELVQLLGAEILERNIAAQAVVSGEPNPTQAAGGVQSAERVTLLFSGNVVGRGE